MSLRWRLALALALLAAAAATVSAVVAYAATDNRLTAQIDHSLQAAARQLAGPGGPPFGASPPATGAENPRSASGSTQRTAVPPAAGLPGSGAFPPNGPGALFDIVVVQVLDANGRVVDHSASVALPVGAQDKAIAQGASPTWVRTETVSATPYRVITVPTANGGAVQVAQSLNQTDGALSTLRWLFTGLAVVITLIGAAVGWLIARRITGPLEELTTTAESVAEGGTLDHPVTSTGRDEVGRLGRAFSTMLGALSLSRRQQRQLVEDAGHELRTPITSLRANIDVLRRHGTELQPAAMEKLLGDLDGELRELTDLVDEVVELATDSRDVEATTQVPMDEVVARVAERARTRTGRQLIVHTGAWRVEGREHALERAVANLVDNAIKFSDRGTPIEIDAPPGYVVVRDHGSGISDEDRPHVFDRFYRSISARSLPGSGLGLSIVREVAEAHGGTVVARVADGGGAELALTLPVLS